MVIRVSFTVSSDLDELPPKISKAANAFEAVDVAGAALLNRIRTRFLSEEDPDGFPWEPSQAAIKRRRGGGTGTLFDTGNLFHSIQLEDTSGGEEEAASAISTDTPYAPYHQFGTSILPRRAFLGVNDEDIAIIERLLGRKIERDLA